MNGRISVDPTMTASGILIYIIVCIAVLLLIVFIINHIDGFDMSEVPKALALSVLVCLILRMTLFNPFMQVFWHFEDFYNPYKLNKMTVYSIPLEQARDNFDADVLMGLQTTTIDDLIGDQKEYTEVRLLKFMTSQQFRLIKHIKNTSIGDILATNSNATSESSSDVNEQLLDVKISSLTKR